MCMFPGIDVKRVEVKTCLKFKVSLIYPFHIKNFCRNTHLGPSFHCLADGLTALGHDAAMLPPSCLTVQCSCVSLVIRAKDTLQ